MHRSIFDIITIRPLRNTDRFEYLRLMEQALREHPEAFPFDLPYFVEQFRHSPEPFHRLLRFPASFLLGAFFENELVSMLRFRSEPANNHRVHHRGAIDWVYTDPTFRRLGIAHQLLRTLFELIRTELPAIEQLHTAVASSNVPLRRLYQRWDFQQYGTEPRAVKLDDDVYEDYVLYVKFLKP